MVASRKFSKLVVLKKEKSNLPIFTVFKLRGADWLFSLRSLSLDGTFV